MPLFVRGRGWIRILLALSGFLGILDQMNLQRPWGVEMDVALRKGYVDARLPEFAFNGQMQMVSHRQAVVQTPHENTELKIEAVVTEAQEKGRGLGLTQDHQVFPGDFEKKLLRRLGVGAVSNAHGDDDSRDGV